MIESLASAHKALFGCDPTQIIASPGRVNIIGEHIDYNGGMVLPFSVKQGHYLSFSPSTTIRVVSDEYGAYRPDDAEGWSMYIHKTLEYILEHYHPIHYDIYILSSLPSGVGMSSSTALVVGLLKGILDMEGISYTNDYLVDAASKIEHGAGVKGGKMDQTAIVYGAAGKAVNYDTALHIVSTVAVSDSFHWFVVDSGTKHDLRHSPYNAIRQTCEDMTALLHDRYGIDHLCQASQEQLESIDISECHRSMATHVITEHQRTLEAVHIIKANDAASLGALLNQSHRSLSQDYGVSTVEMDQLVHALSTHPDVYGCRMMGGGFGGSIIGLLRHKNIQVLDDVIEEQRLLTGHKIRAFAVSPSDGCRTIYPS